jgi:cell shape-determining protein MreD
MEGSDVRYALSDRAFLLLWLTPAMLLSQLRWDLPFGQEVVRPAWDYAVIAYGGYFMRNRLPAIVFLTAGLMKDVYLGFPLGISMLCYFLLHSAAAFLGRRAQAKRYPRWKVHVLLLLTGACAAESALLAAIFGGASFDFLAGYAGMTCLSYVAVHALMRRFYIDYIETARRETEDDV